MSDAAHQRRRRRQFAGRCRQPLHHGGRAAPRRPRPVRQRGRLTPVEFLPGLGFRPVLGQKAMTNFVQLRARRVAPRHVHEEEQIVIVLDGEFTFDLDGDVRVMRKGDVAVVPSWVPHGAWTTDTHCLEVDVFAPPRSSLLKLAEAQAAERARGAETGPRGG